MTEYSGNVTFDRLKSTSDPKDCIRQVTVFDVQWSNCPVEVEVEVGRLWRDYELSNDVCIFKWVTDSDLEAEYPIIAEYLKSRNITECWIHWWW